MNIFRHIPTHYPWCVAQSQTMADLKNIYDKEAGKSQFYDYYEQFLDDSQLRTRFSLSPVDICIGYTTSEAVLQRNPELYGAPCSEQEPENNTPKIWRGDKNGGLGSEEQSQHGLFFGFDKAEVDKRYGNDPKERQNNKLYEFKIERNLNLLQINRGKFEALAEIWWDKAILGKPLDRRPIYDPKLFDFTHTTLTFVAIETEKAKWAAEVGIADVDGILLMTTMPTGDDLTNPDKVGVPHRGDVYLFRDTITGYITKHAKQ